MWTVITQSCERWSSRPSPTLLAYRLMGVVVAAGMARETLPVVEAEAEGVVDVAVAVATVVVEVAVAGAEVEAEAAPNVSVQSCSADVAVGAAVVEGAVVEAMCGTSGRDASQDRRPLEAVRHGLCSLQARGRAGGKTCSRRIYAPFACSGGWHHTTRRTQPAPHRACCECRPDKRRSPCTGRWGSGRLERLGRTTEPCTRSWQRSSRRPCHHRRRKPRKRSVSTLLHWCKRSCSRLGCERHRVQRVHTWRIH